MIRADRPQKKAGRGKIKRFIVLVAIGMVCAGIAAVVITAHPQEDGTEEKGAAKTVGMPVSISIAAPGDYPARITALGEVTARYRSTIKSQVAGKVAFLSDRLQAGRIVRAGEVLAAIEKSGFTVQVAEGESRLKTARLNVLKEEREVRDAKRNWQRSGIDGDPSSLLVLRQPHLEAARADLIAAESALADARVRLGHTEIRAPYDGVVMKRSVDPGETVFAGDEVATLYSLGAVEIGIPLSAAQWNLLPATVENTAARLTDPRRKAGWNAVASRESLHLDPETRLRTLWLAVESPLDQSPPLFPGTFVRASMTGRMMTGLLRIPESAQTREGIVWFVDGDNRLSAHRTEPVFYGDGVAYIVNPRPNEEKLRVAVSPNASFTDGLLVQPAFEEEG